MHERKASCLSLRGRRRAGGGMVALRLLQKGASRPRADQLLTDLTTHLAPAGQQSTWSQWGKTCRGKKIKGQSPTCGPRGVMHCMGGESSRGDRGVSSNVQRRRTGANPHRRRKLALCPASQVTIQDAVAQRGVMTSTHGRLNHIRWEAAP